MENQLVCAGPSSSSLIRRQGEFHENGVIMDNIFKYCSFSELSNHRLVNKDWYEISLKAWKETAPFREWIVFTQSYFTHQRFPEWHTEGKKIAVYYSFLKKYPERPKVEENSYSGRGIQNCTRFHLTDMKLRCSPACLNTRLLVGWGAEITHLKVMDVYDKPTFVDETLFIDILSCKYTPKIESLEAKFWLHTRPLKDLPIIERNSYEHMKNMHLEIGISHCQLAHEDMTLEDRLEEMREEWDVNWAPLVLSFPNLEHLTLYVHPHFQRELNEILNGIYEARQADKTKFNLRSIDIRLGFQAEFWWNDWRNLTGHNQAELPFSFRRLINESKLNLESIRYFFQGNSNLQMPTQRDLDLVL